MKVALFHPWIKSRGGAEKVVLELLKHSKHDIDLYTWVYEPDSTFKEFKKYDIAVLAPKFMRKLTRLHTLRGLMFPLGFLSKIPLHEYDKFLISTSGMGEFITFRNHKQGDTHAYVHTPLREADDMIIQWNLNNRYHGKPLNRWFYLVAVKIYRFLERFAWKRIDAVMFNSHLSHKRAKKRKLLDKHVVEIVFPPVEVGRFKSSKKKKTKNFVYFSRINPPKRQEVLVKAWKQFVKKHKGYTLDIIGTPENKAYHQKIKRMISKIDSVSLHDHLEDKELGKILNSSLAGIFLGYQEDAGIIPLEIISLKKPLLAVNEGGYVDLIKHHKLFIPIKEKHSDDKMIKEVSKILNHFVKKYTLPKKISSLKKYNFVKEVDNFLEKN